MLVKLLDAPEELIGQLRTVTGRNTASKAVMTALEDYLGLIESNNQLHLKVQQLEQKLLAAQQVIAGARSAAALLLEKTSQSEMEF